MSIENKPIKKSIDFTKLEVVNLSNKNPAKWYMYVVKQALKTKEKVDIRARPSAAAQVIRVGEALKKLGYITYVKYETTTVIEDGKLSKFIDVTVQKTKDFEKLFNEREVERNKLLEEKKKMNEGKQKNETKL